MNIISAAEGAQFVGALIGIFLVTSLWLILVSRFVDGVAAVLVASALSLTTASVLGGYGFGSGRPQDMAYAFGLYCIPQLVVSVVLYARRKRAAMDGQSTGRAAPANDEPEVSHKRDTTHGTTSVSVPVAQPLQGAQRRSNFIARHWRGEFSLVASYWGINFVANLALAAAVGALSVLFSPDEGFEPLAIFWFTTVVWLVTAAVVIWQVVGLWRSANRYREQRHSEQRSAFWAGAAQVASVLGVISLMGTFSQSGAPQISELYRMAYLGDPDIPASELKLLAGGTELSIFGGIKYGLANDVERILSAAPAVSVVHLTSGGGRIAEANKLAQLLRQRDIDTYVSNECSSACTLVFAAGQHRSLLDGAKLGYHGLSFPGLTDEERQRSTDEWSRLYRKAGLESTFVARALAVSPETMWYPTAEELLSANAVTAVVTGDAFATSGHELGPSLLSVEQEMRKASGLIDALHAVAPDVAYKIYAATRAGLMKGSDEAALRDELNALIAPTVLANLPLSDDNTLAQYAGMLVQQYSALRAVDPALCFEYAAIGTNPQTAASMPPEIVALEQKLNEQVLRTAGARPLINPDDNEAAWSLVFETMTAGLLPVSWTPR